MPLFPFYPSRCLSTLAVAFFSTTLAHAVQAEVSAKDIPPSQQLVIKFKSKKDCSTQVQQLSRESGRVLHFIRPMSGDACVVGPQHLLSEAEFKNLPKELEKFADVEYVEINGTIKATSARRESSTPSRVQLVKPEIEITFKNTCDQLWPLLKRYGLFSIDSSSSSGYMDEGQDYCMAELGLDPLPKDQFLSRLKQIHLNERDSFTSISPTESTWLPQKTDPRFDSGKQWYLNHLLSGINITEAWEITAGSDSVTVAVIDSGVLYQHPLLQGRLLPGYDMISFIPHAIDGDGRDADASDPGDGDFELPDGATWHGTQVTGLIAATGNKEQGITGIDRHARILPIRVTGRGPNVGETSNLVDAIRWAAGLDVPNVPSNPNPAKVLNISLTGYGDTCPRHVQEAINDALTLGSARAIVVGAGNSSQHPVFAPGNCRDVITVSAVDQAGYSSIATIGPQVTLSAPGHDIFVLSNCGIRKPITDAQRCPDPQPEGAPYPLVNTWGTSLSTPLVSGTVSLMLAANPSLTSKGIKEILRQTAQPFLFYSSCSKPNSGCGAGMLDTGAAVRRAAELPGGRYERSHTGQRNL